MTFGKIIKELRRKADMTQEGLAEALNISGQAVSRWENDLAMPDISLLPILANIFNVTTDHLLGVDITQTEGKISDILHRSTEMGRSGMHKEAAEIIRSGLREYPTSCRLMYWLIFHLCLQKNGLRDAGERREILAEAVTIGEKVLADCTDDDIRFGVTERLCSCYAELGDWNRVKKLADAVPGIWESREFLLASNLRGEEELTAKRRQLCTLLTASAVCLSRLCFRGNTRSMWDGMTSDDVMSAQKNALSIVDMLCPDGDYGSLSLIRSQAFFTIADIYFESDDDDEGVEYLSRAVDASVYSDAECGGSKKHTSPLFCSQAYGCYMPTTPTTASGGLLNILKSKRYFDKIASSKKGQLLIEKLKAHSPQMSAVE